MRLDQLTPAHVRRAVQIYMGLAWSGPDGARPAFDPQRLEGVSTVEELLGLFQLIDADESGTLEKEEILHAIMTNWSVIQYINESASLKPLIKISNWQRAFDRLKAPDRRGAATKTLLRLTASIECAHLITTFKDGETGDDILSALVSLLSEKIATPRICSRAAAILGNLAWHVPSMQATIANDFHDSIFLSENEDSGMIALICSDHLSEDEKGTVASALHNILWNSAELKRHVSELLGQAFLDYIEWYSEHSESLRVRKCFLALFGMLRHAT